MTRKYFFAWFPMIIIAIFNGTLREYGYKPFVGDLTAHWISTLLMILFISLYILAISNKWKIVSAGQSLSIGGIWLIMTVIFEFGFGHYIIGHPWSTLLHDYNIFEGRTWILVLLAIFLLPYLSYKMRKH